MEKIDYTMRASFEEFSSEDSVFIRRLIEDYDIQSILDIPCANGRNLSVIGDNVSSAFFADINPRMVETVQQKIVNEKRTNCKSVVLDMCDLSKLPFEVDTIIIMQQSFQMLSAESGKEALQNLRKANYKRIIIDTYDFLCCHSDLPKFLNSNNTFTDSENKLWVRRSFVSGNSNNWIHIMHEYVSGEKAYFAKVDLYNYSRTSLISLCKECGYTVSNYYTDYSFGQSPAMGRTILVIENQDRVVL